MLSDLYAPIGGDLKNVERAIEDELFSRHPFVRGLCSQVSGYRGKMLRPALVLLSGQAAGESCDDHYTLGAVVELVHLATLVHDDVLDDAGMRRRQPTINVTHGNTTAVLLGDYLISHAYHLCSSLRDPYAARAIGATTNTVCEGEMLEIHHRHDHRLSEEAYFEIIRGKTAALTGTSCALGARYAGADAAVVRSMQEYGIAAGLAFQVVDDILDLTGDACDTGKDSGLDLAHGSATLPVIHCLVNADDTTRRALRSFVQGLSESTRDEVRGWLDSTGSIDFALRTARDLVRSATDHLGDLTDSPARDALFNMAEFIVGRHF